MTVASGVLSKGAIEGSNGRVHPLFYNSAREGMRDLLLALDPSGNSCILMPSYIGWSAREGSGVFDPVRNAGWEVEFYGLNDDLTVNISALEVQLEKRRISVFVLIHYFGRTDPEIERIRQLTKAYGVLLVEDLAHALFSAAQPDSLAGKMGDVLLFSLHKMLPLKSGGMVVYREHSVISSQKSTRFDLANELLSYDMRLLADARRRNYAHLEQLLLQDSECGRSFELLWSGSQVGDVAQSLPVRILRGKRDMVYEQMNARGYGMVSLYHTLIDELRLDERMMRLSSEITNFPVHQDIAVDSLPRMVASFVECLKMSFRSE